MEDLRGWLNEMRRRGIVSDVRGAHWDLERRVIDRYRDVLGAETHR